MPTKLPRHSITETPPVKTALDELRAVAHGERIEFAELLVLGARQKTEELRAQQEGVHAKLCALADMVRRGDTLVDREAADEVRRSGWARR